MIKDKMKKKKLQKYYRNLWAGFFLMFPILFFGNKLKETFWFNIFGILSLIGAGITIFYFVKIIKERKK